MASSTAAAGAAGAATTKDIAGTSYERPAERPDTGGRYHGFDHVRFWVANALQAATYYVARLGFEPYAYSGLETGSRDVVTHVVRQNRVVFAFSSPLNPSGADAATMGAELMKHGDAVKDVAFAVDNCRRMYEVAVKRGAVSVREPVELKAAADGAGKGSVWLASIKTYGDCVHTFVERSADFDGHFLPGYRAATSAPGATGEGRDPLLDITPPIGLDFIDHCVGNQPDLEMTPVCDWYERVLQFNRFWSVDDSVLHTEYSALRSIVMVDYDTNVKMPVNEPADGKRKSQITEYVDYHGGAGVQHIALNTKDIIHAITHLRARGLEFLRVPATYYKQLRERLAASPVVIKEDLDTIEKLNILVDFDDNGYLLQLFTRPVEDRPTLFLEVIQRSGHDGFGAGNFHALFAAIEAAQDERGNL